MLGPMTPRCPGLGNVSAPATPPLVMSSEPASAPPRIHLSVPHMGGAEERYVREAIASNWLSTVGPNIDAFEGEFSRRIGLPSVAVSSGTAALHLGLRLLGVGPGDEVLSPTLTFVASVNPIAYLGATPVFLDSERASWNLDPNVLEHALTARARAGRMPKALVVVHLFGQSADLDPIVGGSSDCLVRVF
jgi:pyridoxal phosphate-dependent aminotransferase EpsN